MKYVFTILWFFISLICFSQNDESIKKLSLQLEDALIKKDSIVLNQLLHPRVQYGHSNGWVQTKNNIFSDVRTGYLLYEKLESKNIIVDGNKKYKTLICKTHAEGEVNKTKFNLNLHVMQVWIKTKNKWQLISRQSAKLAE